MSPVFLQLGFVLFAQATAFEGLESVLVAGAQEAGPPYVVVLEAADDGRLAGIRDFRYARYVAEVPGGGTR